MKPFVFSVLAIFLLVAAAASSAETADDTETLRRKTRETVLMMTGFDFASADRLCGELMRAYPGSPHVAFLESYRCFLRFSLDSHDEKLMEDFRSAIQRLVAAGGAADAGGDQDRLLFLACGHFFLAAIHREAGRMGAALIEIKAMTTAAAELQRRYPGLADARFISGAMAAYSATAPAPTADLELAAMQGFYFAPLARFVLAQALADTNKNYAAALPLYRKLAAEYPDNALFDFHLAWTFRRMGRPRESLAAYRRTISVLRAQPPAPGLLCQSHFAAGQILEGLRRFGDALAEYEDSLRWADEREPATAWFVPWSHLHIARCLERAGEFEHALTHLQAVTKEADAEAHRRAQLLAGEIRGRLLDRPRDGGR